MRTLRWIALAVALIVAALVYFLRDARGVGSSVGGGEGAARPAGVDLRPADTEHERVPIEAASKPDGSEQARTPTGSPAAPDRVVRFRFDDGTLAAGLQICSGEDPRADGMEIRRKDVRWEHRLSASGQIAAAKLAELGGIVAVRTCDAGVELVPIEPVVEQDCVLTSVVEATFVPTLAPDRRGPWFEIWIDRAVPPPYRRFDALRDESSAVPFADRFAPRARALPTQLAFASAQVVLERETPRATLQLPRGRYHLEVTRSPVGWWIDDQTIDVQAGEVSIPVRRVPVVELRLHRDREGKVLVPKEVRILFVRAPTPENALAGAEVAVASEVDGDTLRVGLSYREKNDAELRYALLFDWGDGVTSSTAPGPWEDMLGATDAGWAEPGK